MRAQVQILNESHAKPSVNLIPHNITCWTRKNKISVGQILCLNFRKHSWVGVEPSVCLSRTNSPLLPTCHAKASSRKKYL